MAGDQPTFPAASADEELNLRKPDEFPVDPASSDLATAKELKAEEGEARPRSGGPDKAEKGDVGSSLMSVLVISGVVAAAAVGVAIFVTKKLKEA
ncbi:hypothetical protein OPV22_024717 [Ensete ventricosum]|uniref:Uncharacterized protein n=1 Tax=Ensete ventricosum TaxID=4639 RepID=A0AAV8QHI1_ENSVE|nr:hypothetical protein OPV22_024717 [Ensete ventricosum]RWW27505.1 hypothetical protein GW17_00008066 [Ensete ventricosum]RWW81342.1 hypothetical protein BHE74_00010276 [Ensete ventricosum]RZS04204.1 hypothetical protein BHM03_00034493 [Ensete ventricosum]